MGYLYSLPIYIQYSCMLIECCLFQQQNKILQKSAFVKRMRELRGYGYDRQKQLTQQELVLVATFK